MSFSDVMQNLAVGIIGGIFSSIIVSVVFYLLNEFQTEIDRANDMIYPLYGLISFEKLGKFEMNLDFDPIETYRDEAENNFSNFEPWRFKGGLHNAMCEINNIISDGKYYKKDMKLNPEMISEFSKDIEVQLELIQKCEKNFALEFLRRVFKNKIIIATIFVFMVIILVA